MANKLGGDWNATEFFRAKTLTNRLAQEKGFDFFAVSGLDTFEEAIENCQNSLAMVCVSDIDDGFTELNNTPRTRRVKTVFMAMRHAVGDMAERTRCMETMRELFRQFMSVLILEQTRLEQNRIYIEPRVTFHEIDRNFMSGGACAYFQIAVDVFTDLRFDENEWVKGHYFLILQSADSGKLDAIKAVRAYFDKSLVEAKAIVDSAPVTLDDVWNDVPDWWNAFATEAKQSGAIVEIKKAYG